MVKEGELQIQDHPGLHSNILSQKPKQRNNKTITTTKKHRSEISVTNTKYPINVPGRDRVRGVFSMAD